MSTGEARCEGGAGLGLLKLYMGSWSKSGPLSSWSNVSVDSSTSGFFGETTITGTLGTWGSERHVRSRAVPVETRDWAQAQPHPTARRKRRLQTPVAQ